MGKKKAKKLRRRIYDAMNVLKAADAIEVKDRVITIPLKQDNDKYKRHDNFIGNENS